MKYKAYLFDFDYTLVNSEKGIVECFKHVFDLHNYINISESVIKHTIGMTLSDAFTSMTGVSDKKTLELFRREYVKKSDEIMNLNTKYYSDTCDVLGQLKKQKAITGIISTKYRYRIKAFLTDTYTDDLFDVIVGGEDVTAAKPDPEGINNAVRLIGCKKCEAVYIGDNIIDAMAAQNAGVDFIAVTTGTNTKEDFLTYNCMRITENLSGILE